MGHYGFYQLLLALIIQYLSFAHCGSYFFMVFATLKSTNSCINTSEILEKNVENVSINYLNRNQYYQNLTTDNNLIIHNIKTNNTTDCDQQNIGSESVIFKSIFDEDGFLDEDNSQLPYHMQTLRFLGAGIGSLLGGHMADVFGR